MDSGSSPSLTELEHLRIKIQQLEQTQAQLQQENQTLSRSNSLLQDEVELRSLFISLVSHELRTPLTTVSSYSQHIQESLQKLQPVFSGKKSETRILGRALESVAIVLRQTGRMDKMVSDLLNFSRLQNRRLELNYNHNANLNELVIRVVEQQRRVSPQRSILLEIDSQEIQADFDEHRMEEVLSNLLSNALKYSPSDTPITIGLECREKPDEAVMWVRDAGQGIGLDEQARLFDRFYRVRSANSVGVDGLGLGLFISREIVNLHGGRIWVKSQPGDGSTFYVALPLRAN